MNSYAVGDYCETKGCPDATSKIDRTSVFISRQRSGSTAKVFYLGKHGTPESYAKYYALLAEYNANGKKAP